MNNVLAETHVPLRINIFDQSQNVLVRKHLTVERLIADILREFALELDLNRKYILLANGRQLDADTIIGETNLDDSQDLVLGYYEPVRAANSMMVDAAMTAEANNAPAPTSAVKPARLREMETDKKFTLNKPIMVIGRAATGNPASEGIDIDLQNFREGRSVSRPHARIVVEGTKYMLEALKADRPVFLNEKTIDYGKKHLLKYGDVIGVGKVLLAYEAE